MSALSLLDAIRLTIIGEIYVISILKETKKAKEMISDTWKTMTIFSPMFINTKEMKDEEGCSKKEMFTLFYRPLVP